MNREEKKIDFQQYLVFTVSILISCSVAYFGFQRTTEARLAVLENQIRTQTDELSRQREFLTSTVEPRLRSIETQLAAIRALLEKH